MAMSRSVEEVASIVIRCENAEFIRALMAANSHFEKPAFESSLAQFLRSRPEVAERWVTWSSDQRWTPSAYVQGTETGWYDDGFQAVTKHSDRAAAVADFIHRMSGWLAARRVVVPKESERNL